MKFEELIGKKIAVNCKTEEKAKKFLAECGRHKINWMDGCKAEEKTYWYTYRGHTCYSVYKNNIEFGAEILSFSDDYTIIDFNDIDEFKKPEMTAEEFLKKYDKICESYNSCRNGCPLSRYNNGFNCSCDEFFRKHTSEAICVVSKWENTAKRYKVTYKTTEVVEARSEVEAALKVYNSVNQGAINDEKIEVEEV